MREKKDQIKGGKSEKKQGNTTAVNLELFLHVCLGEAELYLRFHRKAYGHYRGVLEANHSARAEKTSGTQKGSPQGITKDEEGQIETQATSWQLLLGKEKLF